MIRHEINWTIWPSVRPSDQLNNQTYHYILCLRSCLIVDSRGRGSVMAQWCQQHCDLSSLKSLVSPIEGTHTNSIYQSGMQRLMDPGKREGQILITLQAIRGCHGGKQGPLCIAYGVWWDHDEHPEELSYLSLFHFIHRIAKNFFTGNLSC